MSSTLMPIPDRPHPDLLAGLPVLHAMLDEQRRFRLDQLAELAANALLERKGERTVFVTTRDVTVKFKASDPASPAGTDPARIEVAETLAAGARQALADIEAALRRMRAGQYGACTRCGGRILVERLYVIPQAALCVACQRSRTAQA